MNIGSVTICPDECAPREAQATVKGLVDVTLSVVSLEPIDDFSKARNGCFELAGQEGCEWVLMLDTDERIHCTETPEKIREFLCNTPHDMLHVWAEDHSYAKPRLFRLPARGHFKGPIHECWIADDLLSVGMMEGMTFSEIPKTTEQYRAKLERDLAILVDYVAEHPDDPRWLYYLGDTYVGLGEDDAAEGEFLECWELDGWDEESAWACYRMAELQIKRGNHVLALGTCLSGMERHPGMAELPWLAGYCCYHLGRYQHALWWEEMAIALNQCGADSTRINFRHEPALQEGPYDVMAWAYGALGETELAAVHREHCEALHRHRLARRA